MKELIKQIKLKADSIPTNTKENRMVKGAYIDCLMMAKEASKNIVQPAVMPSLPNGKRVLAALKELSDCFTDEERKTMFGNEA
jgi:hypothetical protein